MDPLLRESIEGEFDDIFKRPEKLTKPIQDIGLEPNGDIMIVFMAGLVIAKVAVYYKSNYARGPTREEAEEVLLTLKRHSTEIRGIAMR